MARAGDGLRRVGRRSWGSRNAEEAPQWPSSLPLRDQCRMARTLLVGGLRKL